MFHYNNFIWQSDIINAPGVRHGFSTREGGVSTEAHLASMNTGFFRGDSDENVRENIRLLCSYAGTPENTVCTPQIHSAEVRYVTPCTPILLCGIKDGGNAVIGAVHAGWRGAAAGIAAVAVEKMKQLGAKNICAAVGACIHSCCYEVGEDMRDAVAAMRGAEFAARHIKERDGRLYADIAGINCEILRDSGALQVDVCQECTACRPELYHSHRATGGKRGTMGAVIGIENTEL